MIPIDPALKKPWARVTGNQEVMLRMDSQRRWPEVRQPISQRVVQTLSTELIRVPLFPRIAYL
jgi:hypothetical protein